MNMRNLRASFADLLHLRWTGRRLHPERSRVARAEAAEAIEFVGIEESEAEQAEEREREKGGVGDDACGEGAEGTGGGLGNAVKAKVTGG